MADLENHVSTANGNVESCSSTAIPSGLHPYCNACGWRKGGRDSWDGTACKCGHSAKPIPSEAEILAFRPDAKPSKAGLRALRAFDQDIPAESLRHDQIASRAILTHSGKVIEALLRSGFLIFIGSTHEGPIYQRTQSGRAALANAGAA